MNKELQEKLVKKYPNLYKEYGGDMRKTCMAWGICVGDGWYNIIDELSAKLEPLRIVASQVKEKFGTLRFYIESGNDEVYTIINRFETESSLTCEVCGEFGELSSRGHWLKTLCEKCRKDEYKRIDSE